MDARHHVRGLERVGSANAAGVARTTVSERPWHPALRVRAAHPLIGKLFHESLRGGESVEPRSGRGQLREVAARSRLGRRDLAILLRGVRPRRIGRRSPLRRRRSPIGPGPVWRDPADRGLPRNRPLPGRPRPAQADARSRVARAARPRPVRALRGRPRPHVLHRAGPLGRDHAARDPHDPPRDVLPHDRRRVYAHPQPQGAEVAPGTHGDHPKPAGLRHPEEAPRPLEAQRGSALRAVPGHALRGPEAFLARRRRDAHPAAGRRPSKGRARLGRPRDRRWGCPTGAG